MKNNNRMKAKTFLLFAFSFLVAASSSGFEFDTRYAREYPVDKFSEIELEGNYKVFLYQSVKPFLKVKAPSDDMYDALEIRTEGKKLEVSVRKAHININRIELNIGFEDIRGLYLRGGMKLVTDGFIEVGDLYVDVEGAANADLKLKAKSMEVNSKGGSVFEMEGVAGVLKVKVTGAGHVKARDLEADDVFFRVEGVGFGSVHAKHLLDVKIDGVGKVTFKGTPELKRIVQGLGSVEQS
jgi:hypothetical protein